MVVLKIASLTIGQRTLYEDFGENFEIMLFVLESARLEVLEKNLVLLKITSLIFGQRTLYEDFGVTFEIMLFVLESTRLEVL